MNSTRAFIRLTGITTKALRHYERVGLIAPIRTAAGYRRYSAPDLHRSNLVLALKSLDLPLVAIKQLIEGNSIDLSSHRERIVNERERLTRAIDALSQMAGSRP